MPRIDSPSQQPEFSVTYSYQPPDHTYVCNLPSGDRMGPKGIDELFAEIKDLFPQLNFFSSNNFGRILFVYFDERLSESELEKLTILLKRYEKYDC